ncbi:hypothetical protein KKH65_02540 [bacterium]|nr:hypothetical protein [bacterium]
MKKIIVIMGILMVSQLSAEGKGVSSEKTKEKPIASQPPAEEVRTSGVSMINTLEILQK